MRSLACWYVKIVSGKKRGKVRLSRVFFSLFIRERRCKVWCVICRLRLIDLMWLCSRLLIFFFFLTQHTFLRLKSSSSWSPHVYFVHKKALEPIKKLILVSIKMRLAHSFFRDNYSRCCTSKTRPWVCLCVPYVPGVLGAVGAAGGEQRHPGLYHSRECCFWNHCWPGHHHHVRLSWNAEPWKWGILCWPQVHWPCNNQNRRAVELKKKTLLSQKSGIMSKK